MMSIKVSNVVILKIKNCHSIIIGIRKSEAINLMQNTNLNKKWNIIKVKFQ